jgi:probable rRNA maturation factor
VTVTVEVRNRARIALDGTAAAAVLAGALEVEGMTEGEVGLAVVGRAEMARLNGEHRGRPEATDVLSFPLDMLDALPDGVPRQLGDVVICPAYAQAQGTPIEHLLVHGALHLLGYDHDADDGEMLARQEQIVEELAARAAARPA